MKFTNLLLLLSTIFCFLSCGEEDEPDPRAIFFASYTADEFCDDGGEVYMSSIAAGDIASQVKWNNFLGYNGTDDDIIASVGGNNISVAQQDINGLGVEGSGVLLADGNIDFTMSITAGPLVTTCRWTFRAQ